MTTVKDASTALLEQFGLIPNYQPVDYPYSFSGKELLSKDELFRLFELFGKNVNSSSPEVLASLFSKYYSRIIGVGGLYAMSVLNTGLNLSLQHITLLSDDQWSPAVQYDSIDSTLLKHRDRHEWREHVVRTLFANNLQRVFQSLAAHTRIDISVLWANAAYSIHYYYPSWIDQAETDSLKARIQDDFDFVMRKAKAELFGCVGSNPLDLSFKTIDHPLIPDEKLRLRHKCCLRYMLPETANCTTCPKLTEEARKDVILARNS